MLRCSMVILASFPTRRPQYVQAVMLALLRKDKEEITRIHEFITRIMTNWTAQMYSLIEEFLKISRAASLNRKNWALFIRF